MYIDFIIERALDHKEELAFVWKKEAYSYGWLVDRIQQIDRALVGDGVTAGDIVALDAEFSPYTAAMFLVLIQRGCILVPMVSTLPAHTKADFMDTAQVEKKIHVHGESYQVSAIRAQPAEHELLRQLKDMRHPGMILFSSGSTGKSKAMVHDLVPFLQKYRHQRKALRMIAFMQFDHIGGINTMLYALANNAMLVTLSDRTPHEVCELIEKYQVELLPTSPTFINLLLFSEAYKEYNLESLQTITYGSEVMNSSTLEQIQRILPKAKLMQTYGLSEVGILRSKSESSNSLWLKVGGEGIETRIVDGMLEIKTPSAMLGYLNASSPFTADGWFMTGDMVESKGEFIRFLGRKSEIINVGGEKVFPIEIENILQQMSGVREVAVTAEPNAITGQMVKATVLLDTEEDLKDFRKRMREFCQSRLVTHKIPQKVVISNKELHNDRFKKMRK